MDNKIRPFLPHAKIYNSSSHNIAGWYMSEKLHGVSCFWDGGLGRDIPTAQVPWSNIFHIKTGTVRSDFPRNSSGLWTREGFPIQAPDKFLNQLPRFPLWGELWAGYGNYKLVKSVCDAHSTHPEFSKLSFAILGSPPLSRLFYSSVIETKLFRRKLSWTFIESWIQNLEKDRLVDFAVMADSCTFDLELVTLRESIDTQLSQVYLHQQTRLPNNNEEAQRVIASKFRTYLDLGSEGVILKDSRLRWVPYPCDYFLKVALTGSK